MNNEELWRAALLVVGSLLTGWALVRAVSPSRLRRLRKAWTALRCNASDWWPMRSRTARAASIEAHVQGWNEGFAEGRRVGREAALQTISRLPYQSRRRA